MEVCGVSLLLLLLLTSAKCSKEDVLIVIADKSVELSNNNAEELDASFNIRPEHDRKEGRVSWHAAEEFVDAIKEFGYITRGPVAIYRDDLASDYVAYWMVELNSSQYSVVSSGPETGDYLVSSQGPLPSPITLLDTTAEKYGKKCAKYLMMTPGGEMMCRDKMGKIIATTAEELIMHGNSTDDDPNFENAHAEIDKRITQLGDEWKVRKNEVGDKSVFGKKHLTLSTDSNEMATFTEDYVVPGGVIRVPVDEDTVSVKVKYQHEHKTQTAEEVAQIQKAMCQMIPSCDVNDDCSIDLSQRKSVLHLSYVELEISKDIPAAFEGRQSVEFELRVEQASGAVTVRYYSLDTTKHRQKRYKQYTSYSSWSYASIPYESYFPYYWQHTIKKGCAVGCGPVAWAMVFAYYDRRSHLKSSKYGTGSQDLYRCGSDGTAGSKACVAPMYSSSTDARLKKYIEKIAKVLGTWCIFTNGATPAFKMDRIKGFFQARQKSGKPTVRQTNNIWRLWSSSSIASTTRSWLRSGRPVVVGTTEGGIFKWHYPVATKLRSRSRKYRTCYKIAWKKFCFKWHTQTQHQMYTHQGWRGTRTKWRSMSLHYAAIATY